MSMRDAYLILVVIKYLKGWELFLPEQICEYHVLGQLIFLLKIVHVHYSKYKIYTG